MTIAELIAELQYAIAGGINPDTPVHVYSDIFEDDPVVVAESVKYLLNDEEESDTFKDTKAIMISGEDF